MTRDCGASGPASIRRTVSIPWRPDDDDALSRAANRLAGGPRSHEPLSLVSCGLRTATRDPADIERERKASALFDRIEKACSGLLRGQTGVTEPLGSGWSRNYSCLDAPLDAVSGKVVLHRYRTETQVDLGPISVWEKSEAVLAAPCQGRWRRSPSSRRTTSPRRA